MGMTGWFAASLASFGVTIAGAADGIDVARALLMQRTIIEPMRSATEIAPRPVPAESSARMNLPMLGHDPLTENALRSERADALVRSGCRLQDVCYEAAEGRVVYRGARRYMPTWHGMEPEGLSLRRDRLVLRYSFR
jgi:hypothetical protein